MLPGRRVAVSRWSSGWIRGWRAATSGASPRLASFPSSRSQLGFVGTVFAGGMTRSDAVLFIVSPNADWKLEMNVGSIGGGNGAWPSQNVAGARQPNDGDGDDQAGAASGASGARQVFQQLSALSSTDPTKFKQVATDMAKSLRADAQNASGVSSSMLSKFADMLDQAAQSGALPGPNGAQTGAAVAAPGPQGAHAGHHHHHHHHGSGSSSTSGAATTGAAAQGSNAASAGPTDVQAEVEKALNGALNGAATTPAATATATAVAMTSTTL